MKALIAAIVVSLIAFACVRSSAHASTAPLVEIGGLKSTTAASGTPIDGLAFSLSGKSETHERLGGRYKWVSLELRNVGRTTKNVKGFGLIWTIEVIVSDSTGKKLQRNEHPHWGADAGPSDSSGMPIKPGDSGYVAIPLDDVVSIPRNGIYTVRIRSIGVSDASTGTVIPLVSNTIRVDIDNIMSQ